MTTTRTTPPSTHRLAVRGTDSAGLANGLCLTLGERTTGGLQVVSGLQPAKPPSRNLEIVLDLSGSMKLPLGNSTRIGTARQVLRDVLAKLPDDFNVGLRLYGHRYGSRQKETCTDTELVAPIQKLDRARLRGIVDRTQPRGETPLVYSVLQSAADLKAVGGGSVVLITDGEESCHGDPEDAIRRLKASGIDLTLNIVGFTLRGPQVPRELAGLAEATGGHYYAAQNGKALTRALTLSAIGKLPFTVFTATGQVVVQGQVGDDTRQLPPGSYRVVVDVAGEAVTADGVQVFAGSSTTLRVVLKGDVLALEVARRGGN